jgi:hypothetical protein
MMLALIGLGVDLAGAAAPHESLAQLVTANGRGAAVYELDRLSHFYPHLYQQYDATSAPVADLLGSAYFGVGALDGGGTWLTTPTAVRVLPGTNVLESVEAVGDLEVTQYAFTPMSLPSAGLVQVARVRNASATAVTPAFQLAALQDWAPGGYEILATFDSEHVTENGDVTALYYSAPGATVATCESVLATVVSGRRLAGDCDSGGSAVVLGFGWEIPRLQPGQEAWAGLLVNTEPGAAWIAGRGASALLADELTAWEAFQAGVLAPPGLSESELRVYRQQLAWLAAAQVQEEGAPHGQIPASLPAVGPSAEFSHVWNITWVRDSAYAIMALARAGQVDAAEDALRFLFQQGKSGQYAAYFEGLDYGVSLCRTYGDGREWSDDDGTGPNLELDNLGLFLQALDAVVEAGGDDALALELGPRALTTVADVLVALIGEQGLLPADSSIWERHWSENRRHYTYSQVQAVGGLRAAARIAARLGDTRRVTYDAAADTIAGAIATLLVDGDGAIAQSLEEREAGIGYLDVAAAEVYNLGVLPAEGVGFQQTRTLFSRWLTVPDGDGYKRNDDNSSYDNQEWIFADLRWSGALRRGCYTAEADALHDRVTEMAGLNRDVIPEMYSNVGADYAGPAPMLGFGAGLYVLASWEREELDAACSVDAGAEPEVQDSGAGTDEETCGCGGSRTAGMATTAAALLATLRRRPSSR